MNNNNNKKKHIHKYIETDRQRKLFRPDGKKE